MKAKTTFSLKDQLFNPDKVAYLANQFSQVYPDFRSAQFQQEIVTAFPTLELKERITHIAHRLHAHLPSDYLVALDIVLRALPEKLDPEKRDDDFGEFIIAPLGHFVAIYGCEVQYLAVSLDGLREITMRFSAENAIRYFINAFPKQTMTFLHNCADSENYHVRRLASEGTRPRLPWAQKIVIDHRDPLPILDKLFADKTRYVTRSVANHLNDISKTDPDLVIETLIKWRDSGLQTADEISFITRHALRTLVKKGNHDALTLLGFGAIPDITIANFTTSTPQVVIGTALQFSLDVNSHRHQNLLIDYVMDFAGGKGGRKVFKLKQLEMDANQSVEIRKRHPMRLMTTRQLYAGTHTITLQVNGQTFDSLTFELVF